MKLKYKTLVYKATVHAGLDNDFELAADVKLTRPSSTKGLWLLRERALKELRKEINKELKKVRKEAHE